jgi:hypothetical protein
LPPPARLTPGERLIDHADDRAAQVVAVDVRLARPPERVVALAVLAGSDQLRDPHVRPEREQRQQQPSAQLLAGDVLAGGDRREVVGEAGQVVDLLEHVEQIDN